MKKINKWRLAKSIILLVIVGLLGYPILANAQQVTLTVWHQQGGPEKVGLEKFFRTYETTHPGVKIESLAIMGGVTEKLLTAIAGGTPPDLVTLNDLDTVSFAARGALTPIDSYITKYKVNLEAYIPSHWRAFRYGGKYWGLPGIGWGSVLFYNKTLFSEVGLSPDKLPKTISELDSYAEKLTKIGPEGKIERMGFLPHAGDWMSWLPVFSASLFDYDTNTVPTDDPNSIKLFQWLVSYAKKYDMKKIGTFESAMGNWWGTSADSPFYRGILGMQVIGAWVIRYSKQFAPNLDYGVAPLPYPIPYGTPNTTMVFVQTWVTPKGTQHPEEAFKLLRALCPDGKLTPETRDLYTAWANFTWGKESIEDPIYTADPRSAVFVDVFKNASMWPAHPAASFQISEMSRAKDFVMYGKKTPEEALREAAEKVQQELDKFLKE